MKKTRLLLLSLCFALALAGCDADDATRSNVFLELTSISIGSEHVVIADQTDNQFTASGDYSGEFTTDITSDVTWSSSDTGILTFSSAAGSEGLATAVSPGTVTVRADSGDISEEIFFTVTGAAIVSLTVTPATQDAPVGVESDFDVSGTFDDASTQNLNRIASWTSLDPAVASVTSTGSATGLSVGSAGIQAEWQGVTDVATLNVTAAILTDLLITPADAEYPVGLIIPYSLTGTYSDLSTADLTAQAVWSSDNEARATVENTAGEKGKVEMLASGSTDIVANYTESLTGDEWEVSTGVTINSSTLREIHIYATVYDSGDNIVSEDEKIEAGETLDIFSDETVHLTAIGEYTDAAEYDITTQAVWTSSDTDIVTVSNSAGFEGIATPGSDTGPADITAAFEDLEITITLDVNQP